MRLLASTALVIVTCCALCDFAVTLISVTVKTPAQGRVAQRACFRISQSLLTLDRLGPTQVYDAVVFTSQALSAITSGGVPTTIFLSLSYLLSVASRRKHASPEAKKLVRLARALLNLASITWAFISLLRHIPGFCPVYCQAADSETLCNTEEASARNCQWNNEVTHAYCVHNDSPINQDIWNENYADLVVEECDSAVNKVACEAIYNCKWSDNWDGLCEPTKQEAVKMLVSYGAGPAVTAYHTDWWYDLC